MLRFRNNFAETMQRQRRLSMRWMWLYSRQRFLQGTNLWRLSGMSSSRVIPPYF